MDVVAQTVSEVMQTDVVTLESGERLDLAEDVMGLRRIRHLPVVDGARVVGIVSSRDLLTVSLARVLDFDPAQRRSFLQSVEVCEVMARDVVTVEPGRLLCEAARRMIHNQIGCLPVVESDRTLVGLITETDLLRATVVEPFENISWQTPLEFEGAFRGDH